MNRINNNQRALCEQWNSLLDEVRERRLPRWRSRQIVEFLLYDGEDVRRCDLQRARHDELSPALTPVERLLLFVRIAFSRLQPRMLRAAAVGALVSTGGKSLEISALAEASEEEYRTEVRPQFWQYANLRQIVHLARSTNLPRVLSDVEQLRLYAQWSSLSDRWARVHTHHRIRAARNAISRSHLAHLEEQLSRLPVADIEVQLIRALCLYRRAIHAIRTLPEKPDAAAAAVDKLQQLLLMPSNSVPSGLYFQAADLVYELPITRRGELLRSCRWAIATAFALLPTSRSLDRIGICYLLGQDALLCHAPKIAAEFDSAATRILTAQQEVPFERTKRQIDLLHNTLVTEIARAESVKPSDTDPIIDVLVAEARQWLETDLRFAYSQLGVRSANESLISMLYKDVSQAWISRLIPNAQSPVISSSFLQMIETALDRFRNQPRVASLISAGCSSRLLWARGNERIDDVFTEYERLLAACVLNADWQALIDQLYRAGHRVFLRKIGFEYQIARLGQLATYFEQTLNLKATPAEFRDSATRVNDLLFGTQPVSVDLRFVIDGIENRWRNQSFVPGDDDATIADWAESYALNARRQYFNPDGSDSLVKQFFDDCRTVIEAESQPRAGQVLDEIPVWAGMAWCALHFCHILRRVQSGGQKIKTAKDMTDQDWLSKGIAWADKAIQLSEAQGRPSSLYRSTDVRKRLEKKRGKEKDFKLIEELTDRMLAIDTARLETTQSPSRRNRAILRTERSLCEVMDRFWCTSYRNAQPLQGDSVLRHRFEMLQRLKTFNYGQLTDQAETTDEPDPLQGSFADQLVEHAASPDTFDHIDEHLGKAFTEGGASQLYDHLRRQKAAILDFVTHPGSGSTEWKTEIQQGWGTVCFVIKAGPNGLLIRPFFLEVPESLIRLAVEGGEDSNSQGGLQTDLVYWPDMDNGQCPEVLQELSDRLFPDHLLRELNGCRRVYFSPHRHLFQVPLHALPLHQPFFSSGFETSYALKTSHLIRLLASSKPEEIASVAPWMLIDESSLEGCARSLQTWLANNNQWGISNIGVEQLIRDGASANQAIICCHAQLDMARPGRARLRLWGGGRLVADDIHRLAAKNGDRYQSRVNLEGSEWVIAACDAGRARVTMRTAPGLALSLVSCDAARVTSCLFRVQPKVATRFLSFFLRACDLGHPAPFTAAIRGLYKREGRGGWAEAASFVTYGLFEDGPSPSQRHIA